MTGERKYDVILLDVDGTLLNFDQAEADGMRVVLREYGFEPTDELLEAYHQVNNAYWAAFERGEVTKERLVCQRVDIFRESRQDRGRRSGGEPVPQAAGRLRDPDRRGGGNLRLSAGPVRSVYRDQRNFVHPV